jgi:hypothetical protein
VTTDTPTTTHTGPYAATYTTTGFWQTVGAGIAALARRTGCSLQHHPLPEIREVGYELREWHGTPPAGR